MMYPSVYLKSPDKTDASMDFDTREVRSQPVSTWICSERAVSHRISRRQPRPIIVILCLDSSVRRALESCFAVRQNQERLNTSPVWIWFAMAFSLSNWDEIWELATTNVSKRDAQAHGDASSPPLLQLTQQLHVDLADVIGLREGVRLHLAALTSFRTSVMLLPDQVSIRRSSCLSC